MRIGGRTHGPANDAPRIQIEDDGQVRRALAGAQEGHIGGPALIRACRPEAATQAIGRGGTDIARGRRTKPATPAGAQAFHPHEAHDAVPADPQAARTQHPQNPRTPVAPATLGMGHANRMTDEHVAIRARRGLPPRPGVEPARRDAQDPTQQPDGIGGVLRGDEGEG